MTRSHDPRDIWTALVCVCCGLDDGARYERFSKLLTSDRVSWGALIEHASRHKIEFVLAAEASSRFLDARGIYETPMPRQIGQLLYTLARWNASKNAILHREALAIARMCQERSIPVAFTKGCVFAASLYDRDGSRRLGDIDLLFSDRKRVALQDGLTSLGFEPGTYNWQTGGVRPISRRAQLFHTLHPDHLPSFTKVLDALSPAPFCSVDSSSSMTWSSSIYHVPIEVALETTVSVKLASGNAIPRLATPWEFLHVILHLFREAWHLRFMAPGVDVNLMKFRDIHHYWRRFMGPEERSAFMDVVTSHRLREPVGWVLRHTDDLFETDVCAALGGFEDITDEYLHSGVLEGDRPVRWLGTMKDRLLSTERRRLIVAEEVP